MKKSNELASKGLELFEEGEAFKRLNTTGRDRASRDRRFYTGTAIAFLATALLGFVPSYSRAVAQPRPLGALLHVHALVFTMWLVLLLTQTALVAKRRVDLHRRLGMFGAALAAVMVPIGLMTAISTARSHLVAGQDPTALLAIQSGAILLFAGFIVAALWKRRNSEVHRRLMLLATVCIIPPAIARLPVIGGRPPVALLLSTLFVLAGVIYDWRSRGRVHRVYVWGGLLILVSGPLRVAIGHSGAWQEIAMSLLG